MIEVYLSGFGLDKIPRITEVVKKFGMEPTFVEKNDFCSRFKPNRWVKDTLDIFVYTSECPIQMRSSAHGRDPTEDPNYPIMKAVFDYLEPAETYPPDHLKIFKKG